MESKPKFKPNPESRLMDQVREVLRYYHYAYKTEQALNALVFLLCGPQNQRCGFRTGTDFYSQS